MKQAWVSGNREVVKVVCVSCKRILRTIAERGVIGEAGLWRIGWSMDPAGKPVCDECKEAPEPGECREPGWVRCPAGCGVTVEECEVCVTCSVCPRCCSCGYFVPRSDAAASAEAYDLETVNRFRDLVNRGYSEGWLSPEQNGELSGALLTLRLAMAEHDRVTGRNNFGTPNVFGEED